MFIRLWNSLKRKRVPAVVADFAPDIEPDSVIADPGLNVKNYDDSVIEREFFYRFEIPTHEILSEPSKFRSDIDGLLRRFQYLWEKEHKRSWGQNQSDQILNALQDRVNGYFRFINLAYHYFTLKKTTDRTVGYLKRQVFESEYDVRKLGDHIAAEKVKELSSFVDDIASSAEEENKKWQELKDELFAALEVFFSPTPMEGEKNENFERLLESFSGVEDIERSFVSAESRSLFDAKLELVRESYSEKLQAHLQAERERKRHLSVSRQS